MLIECCLVGEKEPHVITLHKDVYKFLRNEAGDLVCDIFHEEHQKRLLIEVEEGYRVYGDEARAEYEEMLAKKELEELAEAEKTVKAKLEAAQLDIEVAKEEAKKKRAETAKGASLAAKRKQAKTDAVKQSIEEQEAEKAELRRQG